MGGSRLKRSRSGLKMSGSGREWMEPNGSGWEWMGVSGSQ